MIEVLFVLIATSLACSILGPFIVLRNLSMMADALSHSVLLGIVLAFILVGDLNSIFLSLNAAVFGVITVYFVELLSKKRLVKHEDALGIVFPMFFSLAVVIITKMFRNAHLDVDIVLMGNPLFAPFIRVFNLPKSLVLMSVVFFINLIFVILFFKELKISTFDKEFAMLNKIKINRIYYLLMTLTSITCVSAFDSVGAILVISLFVCPSVVAYLFSKSLKQMIVLSLIFGIMNCVIGYYIGISLNVSITGVCSFTGMLMCVIAVFINRNGIIYKVLKNIKNRNKIMHDLILIHIFKHNKNFNELGYNSIHEHLNWKKELSDKFLNDLIVSGYVVKDDSLGIYQLSQSGLSYVRMLLR